MDDDVRIGGRMLAVLPDQQRDCHIAIEYVLCTNMEVRGVCDSHTARNRLQKKKVSEKDYLDKQTISVEAE